MKSVDRLETVVAEVLNGMCLKYRSYRGCSGRSICEGIGGQSKFEFSFIGEGTSRMEVTIHIKEDWGVLSECSTPGAISIGIDLGVAKGEMNDVIRKIGDKCSRGYFGSLYLGDRNHVYYKASTLVVLDECVRGMLCDFLRFNFFYALGIQSDLCIEPAGQEEEESKEQNEASSGATISMSREEIFRKLLMLAKLSSILK